MTAQGLEPRSYELKVRCFIHLSYAVKKRLRLDLNQQPYS